MPRKPRKPKSPPLSRNRTYMLATVPAAQTAFTIKVNPRLAAEYKKAMEADAKRQKELGDELYERVFGKKGAKK